MKTPLSSYDIGTLHNDVLIHWTDQGYELENKQLTKTIKRKLLTRRPIRLSWFHKPTKRVQVYLAQAFGREAVEKSSHIRIRGTDIEITRKEKTRVEIPKSVVRTKRLRGGQRVYVELYTLEKDVIPTTEISFETYVTGVYTGKKVRTINIKGKKGIILGTRSPAGVAKTEFWNRVYEDVKTAIIENDNTNNPGGEWFERLFTTAQFSTKYEGSSARSDLTHMRINEFWNWYLNTSLGDFPKTGKGLRNKASGH